MGIAFPLLPIRAIRVIRGHIFATLGRRRRGSNRVNRGGSWRNDDASNFRGANRNNNDPGNRNDNPKANPTRITGGAVSGCGRHLARSRFKPGGQKTKQHRGAFPCNGEKMMEAV